MVVVRTSGIDQLVARHVLAQLQTRHQPAVLKQIKDAIDARPRHAALTRPQLIFDLDGTQCASLLRQQVDDRVPRPTLAMPSLVKNRTSVLGPLRCACP